MRVTTCVCQRRRGNLRRLLESVVWGFATRPLGPFASGIVSTLSAANALALDEPQASASAATEAPSAATPHGSGTTSADEVKQANNPVASLVAFNLQNYYASSLSELSDASANNFILRFAVPYGPILARASLPVTTLSAPDTSASGLGDLNLFVTWRLTAATAPLTLAVGPLYVAPTATNDALGAGKHQLGGAIIMLESMGPLLWGTLIQYQHSIAGDDERASTSVFIPQLFAILQTGGGTYLRSAPIATFDLESGNYYVPFGLGIGHVAKVGGVVVNAFVEPQYTLLSHGSGQPLFQVFSAVNFQFSL